MATLQVRYTLIPRDIDCFWTLANLWQGKRLRRVLDRSHRLVDRHRRGALCEFLRLAASHLLTPWTTSADGCSQFSHPSYLFFLTTLLTLLLHLPLSLLALLSPPLRAAHAPLIVIPLSLSALTLFLTLLSNYLVRRARWKESQRITRMLTDAAARERGNPEENISRALVGVQGRGVWGRFVGFLSGVIGLVAGLTGLILITVRQWLVVQSRICSVPLTGASSFSSTCRLRRMTALWPFPLPFQS
jgi:hypothetical protein